MKTRRSILKGAAALGIPWFTGLPSAFGQSRLRPISDTPPDLSDEELQRVFAENTELPIDGRTNKSLEDVRPFWWDTPAPQEMAVWPDEADTIDYAHLPAKNMGDSFLLDDTALRRIVESHHYPASLISSAGLILFGIRGATLANGIVDAARFSSALGLIETTPNHFDHLCLLGVWDTRAGKVWATPASTVPHVAYLYLQRARGPSVPDANMLPTGLYRYRVGTHRNGSSGAQPGAFLPAEAAFAVIRDVDDGPMSLSRHSVWDLRKTHHGDNIHAGTYSSNPIKPKFYSAGCQVIPGFYDKPDLAPQGDWARFRLAAGLKRMPQFTSFRKSGSEFYAQTSEDGRRFPYLLTTGRDVNLAGRGQLPPTLRFGSAGAKVVALQALLGIPAPARDGIFGPGTQRKLLKGQFTNTGIVDPQLAEQLGLAL